MKRLLIAGFVATALLAVTTTLRSHYILADHWAATAGMAASKRPQPALASRLPTEEFEDMTFVFSTPTKH
jgi:hypothetical protein